MLYNLYKWYKNNCTFWKDKLVTLWVFKGKNWQKKGELCYTIPFGMNARILWDFQVLQKTFWAVSLMQPPEDMQA